MVFYAAFNIISDKSLQQPTYSFLSGDKPVSRLIKTEEETCGKILVISMLFFSHNVFYFPHIKFQLLSQIYFVAYKQSYHS